MMQTLLAERFKLVLHRETRELPMYALAVAKSGPRIHLTEAHESQNPFSMPGKDRLNGTCVSAEMLAKVLSHQLGRSVQDQRDSKESSISRWNGSRTRNPLAPMARRHRPRTPERALRFSPPYRSNSG
jgi:hypothetical protein